MRVVVLLTLLLASSGGARRKDSEEAPVRLAAAGPWDLTHGVDWALSKYVDLDLGSGVRDYRGGELSDDGHRGVEFTVPAFRRMDEGVAVLAVVGGRVVSVHGGEFDRNVPRRGNCSKQNSILVSVSDEAPAGGQLGEVGKLRVCARGSEFTSALVAV